MLLICFIFGCIFCYYTNDEIKLCVCACMRVSVTLWSSWIVGTAHIVCGAGSMYRYVVCPVFLSLLPGAAACGGFAAVGPAGSRYWSIAAWMAPQRHGAAARHAEANVGNADMGSWTQTCFVFIDSGTGVRENDVSVPSQQSRIVIFFWLESVV